MAAPKRKAGEAFGATANAHQSAPTRNGTHYNQKQTSLKDRANILLEQRRNLPIWQHQDEIRTKVARNDVLMLVGETGSGKSTQIPQFLWNEKWCRRRQAQTNGSSNEKSQSPKASGATIRNGSNGVGGCIAILQPRRVAAISLARRVAEEVGTPLGNASPASTVGYSVRFDNSTGPSTRIKFLTDGMFLAELLRDPYLKEYSAVIVDEVHERGVNVDLSLAFLRELVAGEKGKKERAGAPLKVIIMSATADMQSIEKFFAGPGNEEQSQKDDFDGFSDDDSKDKSKLQGRLKVASCHIKGRQYPVTIDYASKAIENIYTAAMDRIMSIHSTAPLPGDILVFLPGQETIENLESMCVTYSKAVVEQNEAKKKNFEKLPALLVLPLFAALPTHLQQRVFQPTPRFTRKIILATDIAETSVTLSGVRHVIDIGKHKARRFRPGLNLDTLRAEPISRSSAAQRAGRAGREAPGFCHRLYTKEEYHTNFEQDTQPEILRTDLTFLVLTLKAHGVDNVQDFPLLTPLPKLSLRAAQEQLLNLNALSLETGAITPIGQKLSLLPVRADLGRILLASLEPRFSCVPEIIDIISALSLEESIFLPLKDQSTSSNPHTKKTTRELLLHTTSTEDPPSDTDDTTTSPIHTARRTLYVRHSDHLTLLRTVQAYCSPTTHDRRAWCDAHAVSHRAMTRIVDVRKQLTALLSQRQFTGKASSKTAGPEADTPDILSTPEKQERVLKCLLTGLWPNTALLSSAEVFRDVKGGARAEGSPYTTLLTKQGLCVHPSSVMFAVATGGGGAGLERASDGGRGKGKRKKGAEDVGTGRVPVIMFTDLIFTKRPYARGVSAVQMNWLEEVGCGE